MGMMVEAAGYKDVKELSEKMKAGKVGLPELQKFIALAKKRAEDSGAYERGIHTMTATQERVTTEYKVFSSALMKFFEGPLKSSFDNMASSFRAFGENLKLIKEEQERTGVVGEFQTAIDFSLEMVRMLGETLQFSIEGLWELYKVITNSSQGGFKQFLADRQMERIYFKEHNITSEIGKDQARKEGLPNIGDTMYRTYKRNGATDAAAYLLTLQAVERNGLKEVPKGLGKSIASGVAPIASTFNPFLGYALSHYGTSAKNTNLGLPSAAPILANPSMPAPGQGTVINNYVTNKIDGSKQAWEIANSVQDILQNLTVATPH